MRLRYSLPLIILCLVAAIAISSTLARSHVLVLAFGFSEPDTCEYQLVVPPDLDLPGAPAFDTTIVRSARCARHLLRFQTWGTETAYSLRMDTVERRLHFLNDEEQQQWLDITDLPAGSYTVSLMACGNGGGFTLRLK